MEIRIRKAERKDCRRLIELVQELAEFERSPDAVKVTLDHFEESGFGKNPVWWAIVAEVDGKIVGFALYYIRFSTWNGQRMYLEDIIVTKEYRGNGIGKLLFERLIEEAKERGWKTMILQVLKWNEPAINFYKKYNSAFDDEWYTIAVNF